MLFWPVAIALAALTATLIAIPLLRTRGGGADAGPEIDIYRDQLAEVDRDMARGTMAPDEAERARTEIARRILAADRAAPAPRGDAPRRIAVGAAVAAAALLVGGTAALYTTLGAPGVADLPLAERRAAADAIRDGRPSQADAERATAALPREPVQMPDDYRAALEQLRDLVPTRPDDVDGWRLLSLHEARVGNFAAAARAQERVLLLLGDDAPPSETIALADRLVAAAGGIVTPETERLLLDLLETAPDNLPARYYIGLLFAQTDSPDRAFALWRDVVERGGPDAPHTLLARAQIEAVARAAGTDYILPPMGGPDLDDMANASDLADEDRAAMITGMVERLSNRLAVQGGPPSDWARLVRAHAVLGDADMARTIYTEALDVFASDADAIDLLTATANEVGLAE